jgi:hypothetical protein
MDFTLFENMRFPSLFLLVNFFYIFSQVMCQVLTRPVFRKATLTKETTELLQTLGGPLCQEELPSRLCANISCQEYEKLLSKKRKKFASVSKNRIIVSVGHNGFGNQMFQHYFAYTVALYFKAKLFITEINPSYLSKGALIPSNTNEGSLLIKNFTDPRHLWSAIPDNHKFKQLCQHNFTFSQRPVDWRERKRNFYSHLNYEMGLRRFLGGQIPCMVIVGFFQDTPVCPSVAKRLWNPISNTAPRIQFDSNDLVVHLRCHDSHYGDTSMYTSSSPPSIL